MSHLVVLRLKEGRCTGEVTLALSTGTEGAGGGLEALLGRGAAIRGA
jgi:hypothetical protein